MADVEMADNGDDFRPTVDDMAGDAPDSEDEDILDEDFDEDDEAEAGGHDNAQGLQPGGMYEHFRFVADKGQQLVRIDKFLVLRMEHASRNRIQMAADAGCIWVNGRPVKSNYRIKPLDVVQIVMDRPRHTFEIVAQDIPLDIVYEDDTVLVVNKPAGMVVHPGHGNYDGTLVNALAWHFRNIPGYDASDPRMGLYTVSTRIPPGCWSWPRLLTPRQISVGSFLPRPRDASTWQWSGVCLRRPMGQWTPI